MFENLKDPYSLFETEIKKYMFKKYIPSTRSAISEYE